MRLIRYVSIVAVLAVAGNGSAAAQIPSNLTYQGVLTDTSGAPVEDGLHEITFSLHAGPTVITPLWLETHEAVPTTNGAFTVVLGSIAPLNIGFDAPRYLAVSVDGGAEMTPRPPLTAVPYARMAAAVEDGTVGTAALTDSSVTTEKIGRDAVRSDRIEDGSIAAQDLADGAVTAAKIAAGAVTTEELAGGAVANASLSDGSITGIKIAAGQVVRSINGIADEMVLAAGSNVTITPNGSTLTIASTAGGGGGGAVNSVSGLTGDVTLVAGSNVTITPSGSNLTIASTAAGGGNTLDGAYDQGGAGVGRVITADAGAVDIQGSGGLTVNGAMGVGTASPSVPLHVFDATTPALRLGRTGYEYETRVESGANRFELADITGATVPFAIESGAPTDAIYVAADGDVGIGTNAPNAGPPEAQLHVAGALFAEGNVMSWDGANLTSVQANGVISNSGNPVTIRRIGNGEIRISDDIRFSPFGATDAVVMKPTTGDVGIGVAAPTARLEVDGSGSTSGTSAFRVLNSSGTNMIHARDDGVVGIGSSAPAANIRMTIKAMADNSHHLILQHHSDTKQIVRIGQMSNSGVVGIYDHTSNSFNHWLEGGDGTQSSLAVMPSAKIGIGISAPAAKLEVEGGAVLFDGTTGGTPVSGAGTRLMWIPAKAAFRAGKVTGTEWDDASIGTESTVAGGEDNTASGIASTVGGGLNNSAAMNQSTIAGGTTNATSGGGINGTIGGGNNNTVNAGGATVAGGSTNMASATNATVGGGNTNTASGAYTTVGGGQNNQAITNTHATVAGGSSNTASGLRATVGGGNTNTASNQDAVVAGGSNNTASGVNSTIGGGNQNTASSFLATVAGGQNNMAFSQTGPTVGGGNLNSASGDYATVPGGVNNTAAGHYSLAAGRRAKANHNGAFVFGDQSDFDFASTAADEFSVRATGGTRFVSAIDGSGNATAGVTLASGGGSWSSISDSATKEHTVPVNGRDIAARVAALPLGTWNYKSQPDSVRHMGPMAQDFHAAFGLGGDRRRIATIDADGVALAAIQGLHAMLQDQSRRIDSLETQNARLRARLDRLEQRLTAQSAGPSADTDAGE